MVGIPKADRTILQSTINDGYTCYEAWKSYPQDKIGKVKFYLASTRIISLGITLSGAIQLKNSISQLTTTGSVFSIAKAIAVLALGLDIFQMSRKITELKEKKALGISLFDQLKLKSKKDATAKLTEGTYLHFFWSYTSPYWIQYVLEKFSTISEERKNNKFGTLTQKAIPANAGNVQEEQGRPIDLAQTGKELAIKGAAAILNLATAAKKAKEAVEAEAAAEKEPGSIPPPEPKNDGKKDDKGNVEGKAPEGSIEGKAPEKIEAAKDGEAVPQAHLSLDAPKADAVKKVVPPKRPPLPPKPKVIPPPLDRQTSSPA